MFSPGDLIRVTKPPLDSYNGEAYKQHHHKAFTEQLIIEVESIYDYEYEFNSGEFHCRYWVKDANRNVLPFDSIEKIYEF